MNDEMKRSDTPERVKGVKGQVKSRNTDLAEGDIFII
jgi:hypothetical protein